MIKEFKKYIIAFTEKGQVIKTIVCFFANNKNHKGE